MGWWDPCVRGVWVGDPWKWGKSGWMIPGIPAWGESRWIIPGDPRVGRVWVGDLRVSPRGGSPRGRTSPPGEGSPRGELGGRSPGSRPAPGDAPTHVAEPGGRSPLPGLPWGRAVAAQGRAVPGAPGRGGAGAFNARGGGRRRGGRAGPPPPLPAARAAQHRPLPLRPRSPGPARPCPARRRLGECRPGCAAGRSGAGPSRRGAAGPGRGGPGAAARPGVVRARLHAGERPLPWGSGGSGGAPALPERIFPEPGEHGVSAVFPGARRVKPRGGRASTDARIVLWERSPWLWEPRVRFGRRRVLQRP